MHHIQRKLIDLVTEQSLPTMRRSRLVRLPGMAWQLPVIDDRDVPRRRQQIGYPGAASGLTLGDLRTDELRGLLAREGLGVRATLVWEAHSYCCWVSFHGPSPDAALAGLAGGVALRPQAGLAELSRTGVQRVSVSAPGIGGEPRSRIAWTALDGDLLGEVSDEPRGNWAANLESAFREASSVLARVPGALEHLRRRAGRSTAVSLPIALGGFDLAVTFEDYRPSALRDR